MQCCLAPSLALRLSTLPRRYYVCRGPPGKDTWSMKKIGVDFECLDSLDLCLLVRPSLVDAPVAKPMPSAPSISLRYFHQRNFFVGC